MKMVKRKWISLNPNTNNGYLQHHGIEGQKWGVRRFENEDGTLTPEGKERYYGRYDYSTTNKRSFSDVMLRKNEETGKTSLSPTAKALLIGAGITTASLAAAIGTGVIIHKAGGVKEVNRMIRTAFTAAKNSPTNDILDSEGKKVVTVGLKTMLNESRKALSRLAFNVNADGSKRPKIVGPENKAKHAHSLMQALVNTTVFNREYSKRVTIAAIDHLLDTPKRINEFVEGNESVKMVDKLIENNALKTITGLLGIGSAAIVGSAAYELKAYADKQDPTGEKGRYIAPNPNKKK